MKSKVFIYSLLLFFGVLICKWDILNAGYVRRLSLRDNFHTDTLIFRDFKESIVLHEIHWGKIYLNDTLSYITHFVYDSTIQNVNVVNYTYNINDDYEDLLFFVKSKDCDSISQTSEMILFAHSTLIGIDSLFIYTDRIYSNRCSEPLIYYNLKTIPYSNNTKYFNRINQSVDYSYPENLLKYENSFEKYGTTISISPNPILENGNIVIYNPPIGNLIFAVYDLNGCEIERYVLESTQIKLLTLSIQSDEYANGVYFGVLFKDDEIIAEHSIIINK